VGFTEHMLLNCAADQQVQGTVNGANTNFPGNDRPVTHRIGKWFKTGTLYCGLFLQVLKFLMKDKDEYIYHAIWERKS